MASSPNGLLYARMSLSLNPRSARSPWHNILTGRPRLDPSWGRFSGHLAFNTEFNGIGGLPSYAHTRVGSFTSMRRCGARKWYVLRKAGGLMAKFVKFTDALISQKD